MSERKDQPLAERVVALEARLAALEKNVSDNYRKNETSHDWIYRLLKRNSDRFYLFLGALITALIAFIAFLIEVASRFIEAIGPNLGK